MTPEPDTSDVLPPSSASPATSWTGTGPPANRRAFDEARGRVGLVGEDVPVTYRTAAHRPLRMTQPDCSDRAYAPGRGARWRRLGLPATVVRELTPWLSETQIAWLAQTFSLVAVRRVAADRADLTRPGQFDRLVAAAAQDLSRTRGYLSKTTYRVTWVAQMVQWEIPSALAVAWQTQQPLLQRAVQLPILLFTATTVNGVPAEDLAGWVRFAVHNEVMYTSRGAFLGGDTGLFVAAGVSPAEAARMVQADGVDRQALYTLAALRAGAIR